MEFFAVSGAHCRYRVSDGVEGFDYCGRSPHVADRCREHVVTEAREIVRKIAELDARRVALSARLRQLGLSSMLDEDFARRLSEAIDLAECTDDERQGLRDWIAQEIPKPVGSPEETVAWMLSRIREP